MKQRFITFGNTGRGKSFLWNVYHGKVVFASGVSIGRGLTSTLQHYEDPSGMLCYDTTGFGDVELTPAAKQQLFNFLHTAYEQPVHFLFVITLEAGRIKPEEQLILAEFHSILPLIGSNYSVVINQVTPPVANMVNSAMDTFLSSLSSKFPPPSAKFVFPYYADINQAISSPPAGFREFVKATPSYIIKKNHIFPFSPIANLSLEAIELLRNTRIAEVQNEERRIELEKERIQLQAKKEQERILREAQAAEHQRQLEAQAAAQKQAQMQLQASINAANARRRRRWYRIF